MLVNTANASITRTEEIDGTETLSLFLSLSLSLSSLSLLCRRSTSQKLRAGYTSPNKRAKPPPLPLLCYSRTCACRKTGFSAVRTRHACHRRNVFAAYSLFEGERLCDVVACGGYTARELPSVNAGSEASWWLLNMLFYYCKGNLETLG